LAKAFAAQHWKPSPKSNCPQFGGLRVLRGGCSGREVRYSGQHLPVNSVGSSHGSVHRPRRIRFTRAMTFVASWFTHLLRSASLLAPCTDLTGCPASGAFTSRLPAGWSPFQLQDITTTATGLLCWRDSHPLEWQLASLHLLPHRSGLSPHTPCQFPGALTRVAACTLALSPIRDTLIEGFSHFVTSMTAPIASGWSGCRVGLAPTGKRRLCTAHAQLGHWLTGAAADDYAALATRSSISVRSATKSMGFVRSASAPPSRAFLLVLSSS
jgi:hypothetical protein